MSRPIKSSTRNRVLVISCGLITVPIAKHEGANHGVERHMCGTGVNWEAGKEREWSVGEA